jgi:RNA polymerase sigma factor (TIGR02999 family)
LQQWFPIVWQNAREFDNDRSLSNVTHILEAIERGDPNAAEKLLPLVYAELRKLAASKMGRESAHQTLQPTALVHEAWLRLVGNENQHWNGRAHFFGAAAEAMRRILIEKARYRGAQRHGGGLLRVDVSMLDVAATNSDEQLFAVNEALDKLAAQNPEKAELVKLRYFVGMTIAEAAEALGISEPAARRQWAFARAWLFREIKARRD